MGKRLTADYSFFSLESLTPIWLQGENIKVLLLDMDNTMTRWREPVATPELREWVRVLCDNNVGLFIVSNSRYSKNVGKLAGELGLPYLSKARKPGPWGFRAALRTLGASREEALVVGDQLFTDILGGNLSHIRTCLVCPIADKEHFGTRCLRVVERLCGRRLTFQQEIDP